MYTVHPEDVLLVRHPEPEARTGPMRAVKIANCQCSCHRQPRRLDNDDSSVSSYLSYSNYQHTHYYSTLIDNSSAVIQGIYAASPQRTTYGFTLTQTLPVSKQANHRHKYSVPRSSQAPSGLRHLLMKLACRRKAPKPTDEGACRLTAHPGQSAQLSACNRGRTTRVMPKKQHHSDDSAGTALPWKGPRIPGSWPE